MNRISSTLTDMKNHPVFTLNPQGEQAGFSAFTPMKNHPVFTLNPQGEQAGFSAFTPWGRGKKAEKQNSVMICQSRIN